MKSEKIVTRCLILISLAALAFLIWLIYFNSAPLNSTNTPWLKHMAGVNAGFNFLSACSLILGFKAIKSGNREKHIKLMKLAFFFSFLFLIGYIIYHYFHGETKFLSQGPVRYVYFFILISHIILSAFTLPLVLITFYYGLSAKYEKHKKIVKWTFPIWLYVSLTGVIIYFMLKFIG